MKFYFSCLVLLCSVASAQYSPPGGVYPDAVFSENIKTARIFKEGWETSYPITRMDDETPLILSFDELSKNARNYSYIIIHCDADWRQSRLNVNEYMTGFPVNQIRRRDFSFNTVIPYVHYQLAIPNEDVQLKASGNYVALVFEDGNEDRPVMSRRFSVTESLATISATAGRARQTAMQDEWQQVDFTVRTGNVRIDNAHNDVKVVVLQNGKWHTARTGIRPLFIRQNELDYRHLDNTLLFHAGNEYRPLDLKSTRFSSTGMTSIEFDRPTWRFHLNTDLPRTHYQFVEDFNGKYAIHAEKSNRHNTEADYVYAHFSLRAPQPFADGQLYVTGDFCIYAPSKETLMTYNAERQQYEATILLKQGYYNYKYVLLPSANTAFGTNWQHAEGNFSDAENDYAIYVYHRGRSDRYDRLIAVNVINTLKK